jgi:ppGpp synthetase/RelA/SpoT-type nucleotidyltranferase
VTDDDLTTKAKLATFAAEHVHGWCRDQLLGSAAVTSAYAFKNRIKSWEAVKAKVRRMRSSQSAQGTTQSDCQPTDLGDISGFRIVTLFQSEMVDVLSKVLDLIATKSEKESIGSFISNPVEAIEIRSSRPPEDPLSIRNLVHELLISRSLEGFITDTAQEVYSSLHMLVKARVGSEEAIVEIQIRSVFEDAWSEVNHKLRYGPTKAAVKFHVETGERMERSGREVWHPHLDALKSLSDGCAQYADLIHRDFLRNSNGSARSTDAQSVDTAEETKALFSGCSPSIKALVSHAVDARDEAEKLDEKNLPEREAAFTRAAEGFSKAQTVLETDHDHDLGKTKKASKPLPEAQYKKLRRSLRGQQAFCMMFSKNEELRNGAEKLWRELSTEDPADPIPYYRLAQNALERSKWASARELFEEARKCLKNDYPQYHWVHKALPRQLGYVIWRIAEVEDNDSNKVALLEEALSLTSAALVGPPDMDGEKATKREVLARNNLVYYAWELTNYVESARVSQLRTEIIPHYDYLRNRHPMDHTIGRTDTLMRAAHLLGDKHNAVQFANTIIADCRKIMFGDVTVEPPAQKPPLPKDLKRLSDDDHDSYRFAQEVLLALR